MVVGVGVMRFNLHGCDSLKGKRKIVKSIVQRIKNVFNASVAETGLNDNLRMAEIGFALAGNDRQAINSGIDKIFNFTEELGLAELIRADMEIITL